jgi:hypothetical protein
MTSLQLSIAAVLLLAIGANGCSSGSPGSDDSTTTSPPPPLNGNGASPPPPVIGDVCDAGTGGGGAPGGIWVGELGSGERMLLLAAETGEFRLLSPNSWGWSQIAGTFQVDGTGMRATNAALAWVSGFTWLETSYALVEMEATLDEQGDIEVDYWSTAGDAGSATLSLASYDALYQRGSSLPTLAGTYISQNTTLAIDDQGEIFYQGGSCVGNGRAGLIDPNFNMYRIDIEVEVCTGNTVHAPGRPFSGLAYLSDSGDGANNDVLEFALCGAGAERMLVWNLTARR